MKEMLTNKKDSIAKMKRKHFSMQERITVYRKTRERCYLCGEFVDFDLFEVEHKVPVSKGGTNKIEKIEN